MLARGSVLECWRFCLARSGREDLLESAPTPGAGPATRTRSYLDFRGLAMWEL